jgi:uncharacterized protein (DUF1778 family)
MQSAATTINVRAPGHVRDLIDRAASAQGKSRTDFMLEASAEAAQRVLLDQAFFQVDESRFKAFQAALDQPVKNKQALKRLLSGKSPWES